ncbi:MAG: hypothetical protein ACQEQE_02155 [Bacillota bacterium]
MYIVSFILGVIIVIISIFLIRNEFKKSLDFRLSNLGDFSDFEKRELIKKVEKLQEELDELNNSFYEITNDLEGKFSLNSRQIRKLKEKVEKNYNNTYKENKGNEEVKKYDKKEKDSKIVKTINNNKIDYEEIERLKNQDYTLNEIAKKLDIGIRELNIMMNLYNNKS